ncbi:MAG TPA: methylmalonyl-CoA mutase family protein, partial [Thermaerobacter sp.]
MAGGDLTATGADRACQDGRSVHPRAAAGETVTGREGGTGSAPRPAGATGSAAAGRERRPRFETLSGIEVKRCYGPEDVPELASDRRLGRPGQWPYTRGIHETMYRGRLWTMRQFAGFGTAEQTNQRFKYLLKEGQTGLSVAFDFPTLLGYDSDHPMSDGEVGKLGV